MASFRTARAFAALAALPLAAALFTGVAQADDDAFSDWNASVATLVGGVGGHNFGNSTTTQQVATGAGASNQNNTANVIGAGLTTIDQSNENIAVNFGHRW
ncbi:hypothetical protein KQY30_18490 [Streptomyces sp. GMY02]|uniref:hypothetical protein n=1 Tax=Streptomyces sp. GMY02 TaxID=1333528 RepID=UPI001C2C0874|nr:hypothetical protein [Streptomyces sp. GMY02]QXE35954.1 hypothetical protein KQY30_18490 [Streptomyces sp. GMY02]